MKIAVLCGGTSTEREISVRTGTNVCEALRSKGHNAVLLDIFFGNRNKDLFAEGEKSDYNVKDEAIKIRENDGKIKETQKNRREFWGENVISICYEADIVFMALHGANGEDGKVQASFDLLGIKYTGSEYLGSALAMDKGLTKNLFKFAGIPTPNGYVVKKWKDDERKNKPSYEYPVVVKPACGGSSVGVYIANNDEEYKDALEKAFELEDDVVIEEFIKGREFSVGVMDDKALPIIEIIPKEGFYDYENKYLPGKTIEECPAKLGDEDTKNMQQIAVDAARTLRLKAYSRMDFILTEDGNAYCLEANTLPGMTQTSLIPQEARAIGIEFPDLCEKLINISMEG